MHAGTRYSLRTFLRWMRRDLVWLVALSALPVVLSELLGWTWVAVPWVPVALVGTAAAFIVGFRNNATYARLWEGRQVYGAIVNASRTWGMTARDFVRDPAVVRELVYRHLAWLTALRYQLRQPRVWETAGRGANADYRAHTFTVAELTGDLGAELAALVGPEEAAAVMAQANRATQLTARQSARLADPAAAGVLDPNRHVALQRVLADLTDQQGRCERLKNFPYPRQFATINMYFVRLFAWLLPFGLLGEFRELGPGRAWLTVPFAAAVGWVFVAMERVGEATENPFEGGANDVPITALSRTIEIDLREMLGEPEPPPALAPVHDILL